MLKDIQKEKDTRNIFISDIGICDYKLPFCFDMGDAKFNTIATLSSTVALDKSLRGAHLSRIVEILNTKFYNQVISLNDIKIILNEIIKKSETNESKINANFDIIISEETPISKLKSYKTINIIVECQLKDNNIKTKIEVSVIGTTLCPCSKEISNYGAHSQKCLAKITIFQDNNVFIDINKIINIIENSFSSKVYSTVKREDEKYITEIAYENPKFSEDLIRDLLININDIYPNNKIIAELINYESIHQHNVYAKGVLDVK